MGFPVGNKLFIMSNYFFTYSMSNLINLILFYLFFCTPTKVPINHFFMWALPTPALWNKKEKNVYTIGTDGKRIEDTG